MARPSCQINQSVNDRLFPHFQLFQAVTTEWQHQLKIHLTNGGNRRTFKFVPADWHGSAVNKLKGATAMYRDEDESEADMPVEETDSGFPWDDDEDLNDDDVVGDDYDPSFDEDDEDEATL